MRFNTLDDWLSWQESLNPAEIDLGLERVSTVLQQAELTSRFDCPLIIVAGTNGKGSVVAMLESIAIAAGLQVCCYTSPHLFRYNERIRINGKAIDDKSLCQAFGRIDRARNDVTGSSQRLTYFEFGTLAAIDLFFRQQPELIILEVGLGGRLDAVNVMDADVAIITSVAIDHTDWLGDDRESIGFEKAGIFRAGQMIICAEEDPPVSVLRHAEDCQCELYRSGREFSINDEAVQGDEASDTLTNSWVLNSVLGNLSGLPSPALAGEFQKANAAAAILALQALNRKGLLFADSPLSPTETDNASRLYQSIISGLLTVSLAGRFQQVNTGPDVYVDVAHNPQAAQALASQLEASRSQQQGRTRAIVAMLSDKDVAGVIDSVRSQIDDWCFAGLQQVARGLSAESLVNRISETECLVLNQTDAETDSELRDNFRNNQCKMLSHTVMVADTVDDACQQVLSDAASNDRIVIFGSFYTVSDAIQFFARLNNDDFL